MESISCCGNKRINLSSHLFYMFTLACVCDEIMSSQICVQITVLQNVNQVTIFAQLQVALLLQCNKVLLAG